MHPAHRCHSLNTFSISEMAYGYICLAVWALFTMDNGILDTSHFMLRASLVKMIMSGENAHIFNGKNAPRILQIFLAHFFRPVFEYLLGVELHANTVSVSFELLAVNMGLPSFAKHSFDTAHVHVELWLDLLGPNDAASHSGNVAHFAHS
ncbi:hypothetical protein BpHYR1_003747, partial [Brachionus plicatilis]